MNIGAHQVKPAQLDAHKRFKSSFDGHPNSKLNGSVLIQNLNDSMSHVSSKGGYGMLSGTAADPIPKVKTKLDMSFDSRRMSSRLE